MVKKESSMADARITKELIEHMRSMCGLKLDTKHSIHNEYATRMAILKFAEGIGDTNPLWCDEEYARKTRYGGIIAPPSFLWACLSHVQFGWAGLGGFQAGCDMEFFKPVYLGDKITAEVFFDSFEGPKASTFAEEMIIDHFHTDYRNQNGDLLAKYHWWIIRVARAKAKEKGKYQNIKLPYPWKEEELRKIEEEVLSEEIRGANPRYWEDVRVGDTVSPIVKGPLGLTDVIAFCTGGAIPTPRLMAHGAALRQYRRHPAWAFRDSNTYALEPVYAVHYNKEAANAMGLPYPYFVGTQIHCWAINLLTNWMGDDGWLKRSFTRYQKFVFHSDVVRCEGKITKKYIDDDGDYCVDIDRYAINQRQEKVVSGNAIVALPSRDNKYWPTDKRLRHNV